MGFLVEGVIQALMDWITYPLQRRVQRWSARKMGGKTIWGYYKSRRAARQESR
jgi:hypothetical protein